MRRTHTVRDFNRDANSGDKPMMIRVANTGDAQAIEKLAAEFHDYLIHLGDTTNFFFNASTYLRDGFGDKPHSLDSWHRWTNRS